MRLLQVFKTIQKSFFCEKYKAARKRQRFIRDIATTQAFSKMNNQDKITSLAKLIFLYECDYGPAPRCLEQMLLGLNSDLKRKVLKDWSAIYAGKW